MVTEAASTAENIAPARAGPTWLALVGFGLATRLLVVVLGCFRALPESSVKSRAARSTHSENMNPRHLAALQHGARRWIEPWYRWDAMWRAMSIAMAWNQATTRLSGGRSRREARRAGRRQGAGAGSSDLAESSGSCSQVASAGLLLTEVVDGAFGRPESPHGADVIWHGPSPAPFVSASGSEAGGWIEVPPRPQQHDAPSHLVPHLQ